MKAGLTELPSISIKPPRVAESPASFECRVNQVISLGNEGGAGNLIVCEILLAHFKEDILDAHGVDPQKLDAVARMGGDYYCRAHGSTIFKVPKPNTKLGIGFDQLPEKIRNSKILSGNDLGRLANIEKLPDMESPDAINSKDEEGQHLLAKKLLAEGKIEEAWRVLLNS